MGKEFPLLKCRVLFNDELLKYDYLRSNYGELLLNWEKNFKKYYREEVITVVKLNEALQKFIDEFTRLIDFSVFILMEHGIDYIDQPKFVEMLKDDDSDYDPFYIVEKSVNTVKNASEKLAHQIQSARIIERSSRSHWEGGGFGLKGALKGAITAGALNIATSSIRSIGDSITDSRDKSKFNRFIKDALQNPDYGIEDSFTMSNKLNYYFCLTTTHDFLVSKGKLPDVSLGIDKYKAKINNYMQFGNFDVAYDLLIKAIQINPYEIDLYDHLYSLVNKIATNENERELFKDQIDGLFEYFRPDIFEI